VIGMILATDAHRQPQQDPLDRAVCRNFAILQHCSRFQP